MPVTSIARPTDTPLARLTAPELFLITSTRLWVAPYRHPSVALPDWQEGFASAQLDQRCDGIVRYADPHRGGVEQNARSISAGIAAPISARRNPSCSFASRCWQRKRFNESLAFVAQLALTSRGACRDRPG